MDRPVAPPSRRRLIFAVGGGVALVAALAVLARGPSRLVVDGSSLRTAVVEERTFRESVLIEAEVAPVERAFLETRAGGRVERIDALEGTRVEAGQVLLALANPDLDLEVLRLEERLQAALAHASSVELEVEEGRRQAERRRLEIEHSLLTRKKDLTAQEALHVQGLTPDADLERAQDEVAFWENVLHGFGPSEERSEALRRSQLERASAGVERWRESLAAARRNRDELVVAAPIGGILSSFDVEMGEVKPPGARLGQVDGSGFRLEGRVDQIYAARVAAGQEAEVVVEEAGRERSELGLRVETVYPEVTAGHFRIDMGFQSMPPAAWKRGQRLRVRLHFGEAERALAVPQGPYFQTTGGRWLFVLSEDGRSAERRDIRIGRKGAAEYEVVSGLAPGDRVIVSRYDGFADHERLSLRR